MPRPMPLPTPMPMPHPVAANAPVPPPPYPGQALPQAGHAPAPQAPAHPIPAPHAPLHHAPAPHAPVHHTPAHQAPAHQAPAHYAQPGYPAPVHANAVPMHPQFNPDPHSNPDPQGHYAAAAPHADYPGLVEANPALMNPVDQPAQEGGERALPQLSIHAFCDRNDTAGCIDQMTRDWRMRRTNTKIYMGGLQAAVDYYHKETTPGLIIIESGMRGAELFNQLEQLASVCDEGTKVVLIGAANDIRLYRQLMDKGVSDYIVPPLHPLNMIRSLSEIYADPDKPFTGRAIAFFGSKGGVGSSTLAHNLAWTLSERLLQETSLIDLDSSWGTTALDFAYDNASGLEEALSEVDRLDDTLLDRIMVRHTERLSILPTSSSLNVKPVVDSAAYEAIIGAVRSISPLAILDLPHIWNDWTTNVLTIVDDVVITAVPDLANLRNTKNLIDFLKAQRPNDAEPVLILNQTGRCKNKDDEISVENFAGAVGLDPSLVIGFDPDTFNRACNEGKMLPEMKTTDALVPGLDYLANRLRTGQFTAPAESGSSRKLGFKLRDTGPVVAGTESKSLFASLLRKKG